MSDGAGRATPAARHPGAGRAAPLPLAGSAADAGTAAGPAVHAVVAAGTTAGADGGVAAPEAEAAAPPDAEMAAAKAEVAAPPDAGMAAAPDAETPASRARAPAARPSARAAGAETGAGPGAGGGAGTGAGLRRGGLWLFVPLVLAGAAWGMSQPLSKIAVSQGYRNFGLVFWQSVVGAAAIGTVVLARGRGLPLTPPALRRYVAIALIGAVLPNAAGYEAARHLPAGLLSLMLSMMPMLAFPLALALRTERFSPARLAGLALGLGGVLLIALPDAGLPEAGMIAWLPLALVAPFFYALEVNVVARWGMGGTDPIQLLFGAATTAALISAPLALAGGQWIDPRPPWGAPDAALVTAAVLNISAYTTYVWLVGRAGPSFAAQTSYLVTGFGVLWAMLLLGERFSGWVWGALAVMMAGVALVQPQRGAPAARDRP